MAPDSAAYPTLATIQAFSLPSELHEAANHVGYDINCLVSGRDPQYRANDARRTLLQAGYLDFVFALERAHFASVRHFGK